MKPNESDPSAPAALSCIDISKSFAGVRVLDGVHLSVPAGSVHGLIGPNGAGKTTLINIITGFLAPDSGEVLINGERATGTDPLQSQARGLRRTFQTPRLVDDLTVMKNVELGAMFGSARAGDDTSRLNAVLRDLKLMEVASELASDLPAGMRRTVELARALVADPRALLLDEPLAGLAPSEVGPLLESVDYARIQRNVAVLLIEHNLGAVFDVADEVSVLSAGEIVICAGASEVSSAATLRSVFGGSDDLGDEPPEPCRPTISVTARQSETASAKPMLQMVGVSSGYGRVRALQRVDLDVARGAVTAMIGLNGAGKSTALNTAAGLLRCDEGQILIDGSPVGRGRSSFVDVGVALVPQDRHLFASLTSYENLRVAAHAAKHDDPASAIDEVLTKVRAVHTYLYRPAGHLSGGQQQLLAIARAMITRPRILLVDEPSIGIATHLLDEIGELLLDLCEDGMTVLLAEQNVSFARNIASSVCLIDRGRVFDHLPAHEAHKLWDLMLHHREVPGE